MRLLDTDVVSFDWRDDTRFPPYFRAFLAQDMAWAISAVTAEELRSGAIAEGWSLEDMRRLNEVIGSFEIVPVAVEIEEMALWLRTMERAQGRTLHENDSLIAATALCWKLADMCLVTNNFGDYEHLTMYGLRVLSLRPPGE